MILSTDIQQRYLSFVVSFSSSFRLPNGGNADFLNMSFWSDDITYKYLWWWLQMWLWKKRERKVIDKAAREHS